MMLNRNTDRAAPVGLVGGQQQMSEQMRMGLAAAHDKSVASMRAVCQAEPRNDEISSFVALTQRALRVRKAHTDVDGTQSCHQSP